jgi:hypothetical protein
MTAYDILKSHIEVERDLLVLDLKHGWLMSEGERRAKERFLVTLGVFMAIINHEYGK